MEERGSLNIGGHVIDVQWDGQYVFLFDIHLSTGVLHSRRFDLAPTEPISPFPLTSWGSNKAPTEELPDALLKSLKRKKMGEDGDEDEDKCEQKVSDESSNDAVEQQGKRMKMDEEKGDGDGAEGKGDEEAKDIKATPTINDILPPEIVAVILHHASESSKKVMWVVGRMVCRLWKDLLPSPTPPLPIVGPKRPTPNGRSFVVEVAKRGWVFLLQWAAKQNISFGKMSHYVLRAAAKYGHLHVLEWAKKQGWYMHEVIASGAAKGGHMNILKWFKETNNKEWGSGVTGGAAKGGHLEILKWLREQSAPWSEYTCAYAAKKGHLEVLKWLRENGCPWNRLTCIMAAHQGHLEVVQWARQNGCNWALKGKSSNACLFAAIGGHLEVLKWLRENGCPWTSATCYAAAAHGHFELLKWARKNGCPWSDDTSMAAAMRGDIEMLKWLMQNGCPWDLKSAIEWPNINYRNRIDYSLTDLPVLAGYSLACIGALDVLKFSFENGAQWDESLCSEAARGGQFEVLKWLRENSCPWDSRTMLRLAIHKRHEMLRWAGDAGCPMHPEVILQAIKDHDIDTIRWARFHQCAWDAKTTRRAAKKGYLNQLECVIELGAPWHAKTIEKIVKKKNFEMLKWAFDHGCPWEESQIFLMATLMDDVEVLKWAFDHGCTWGDEALKEAVKQGAEKLLRWIHGNGHPVDFEQLADLAIKANKVPLVKWCLKEEVELESDSCALAAKHGSLEVLKFLHKKDVPWDTNVIRVAMQERDDRILEWILNRDD